jgi:hypothetical protein
MTPIFHITHIDNLPSILADGCLWCDAERNRRKIQSVGIAHNNIKQRRANRIVPICQKGVLSDYVPLYFAPRSPMLGAIHVGKVQGYAGGQSRVVHLVSSVETVIQNQLPFTFTNGHAEMQPTRFYEDIKDLDKIDWALMRSKMWNDTKTDGNRLWRRNAEFLVHNSFPFSLFIGIGVMSQEIADQVAEILAANSIQLAVKVRQNWYY